MPSLQLLAVFLGVTHFQPLAAYASPAPQPRALISHPTFQSRSAGASGDVAVVLNTRDDISVGIDWTTLSKAKDISVFTLDAANTTNPGPTDLLYATADGYRFGLPWWTGIPGAVLNLFIALRIITNDAWRWKGKRSPLDHQQYQSQQRWSGARRRSPPGLALATVGKNRNTSEAKLAASVLGIPFSRSPSPPTDDEDEDDDRPRSAVIIDVVLRYLQLAYLLVQAVSGLVYIVSGTSGGGEDGTAPLRFAGPAAYCLVLAVVCQLWSALFALFSPEMRKRVRHAASNRGRCTSRRSSRGRAGQNGKRNAKQNAKKRAKQQEKRRLLSIAHAVVFFLLSLIAAVLAVAGFFVLTAQPAGQAPVWQVWSPWCVPYGYIAAHQGVAGGAQNASAVSGFQAGEFVYKAPAGTGTAAYPTDAHHWPCADAAGLSLYEADVSFFPRLPLDLAFGAVACVLLLASAARLVQLKAWRRPARRGDGGPYGRWIINGVTLLAVLVTCLFAALKFYDLARLESGDADGSQQWYFGGSYVVCPGLVNTTVPPFNVSGIGMCFGVQVALPARARGIQAALDMDMANLAQLIWNV